MNSTASVAISAGLGLLLSSVWYIALTPVEVRVLGPAAPERGGRPLSAKALLHAGDWLLKLIVISAIVGLWL
jgi:hypothetical protein